ncbi:UDP-N-acetylmuramate dehydrogenase [Deltaproteobacteria bacterium]|nr:UDP-N-acetylmuramate dehydrogenase [Deltaproteobacteria bacterium]
MGHKICETGYADATRNLFQITDRTSHITNFTMNKKQQSELAGIVPDGIEFNCPMDQYTTFRAGGKAEVICFPSELETLSRVVSYLHNENIPCLILGNGSNVLVKDNGIEGVVIVLKGRLAAVEKMGDRGEILLAGGGLSIAKLLSYSGIEGFSGLEFLAGIPGTVGGAVFMNAGAFGWEIGSTVQEIRIVTGKGEPSLVAGSQLNFSYRGSSLPKRAVIHGVKFKLHKEHKDKINGRIADYLKKRKKSQPLDFPSAGSVFRNPPGDHAGRLIEEAGLKGTRIGGAMISPMHANFIVNTGGAKAEHIIALMDLARGKVREETGIDLEPEIKVVGK